MHDSKDVILKDVGSSPASESLLFFFVLLKYDSSAKFRLSDAENLDLKHKGYLMLLHEQ